MCEAVFRQLQGHLKLSESRDLVLLTLLVIGFQRSQGSDFIVFPHAGFHRYQLLVI